MQSSSPTASSNRQHVYGRARSSSPSDHGRERRVRSAAPRRRLLARYLGWQGDPREVVVRDGSAGSLLVIDRDAATHGDRRLLAHLCADEPAANAALVCADYLQRTAERGCPARRVLADDARTSPLAEAISVASADSTSSDLPMVDSTGRSYFLERVDARMSIPELRWRRRRAHTAASESVSLREVIASLENYEPVCGATVRILALHRNDVSLSTTTLRAELARVQASPIVLNRALREVVLASVRRQQLSMSEIAIRCGRIKRDCKGKESGETSWLARRLGLLPEGGQSTPTPWIHSDVLGLIARAGLGISPREVELG
jgi:hypothetical protein